MPLHRTTHAEVADLVAALEADGYSCAISPDDAGVYVMASKSERRKAGEVETR